MIIGARQKLEHIRYIAIATVIDAMIVGACAAIFHLSIGEAFMAYIAIHVASFALWLRRTAVTWVTWILGARQALTSHVLDYLKTSNFSAPDIYLKPVASYFHGVASNEEIGVNTRLAAMGELAFIVCLPKLGLFQHSLRVDAAYEAALTQYRSMEQPA